MIINRVSFRNVAGSSPIMTQCFPIISLLRHYVIPQLDWGISLKRKGIPIGMPCLLNLAIPTLDVGIFTPGLPEQARQ